MARLSVLGSARLFDIVLITEIFRNAVTRPKRPPIFGSSPEGLNKKPSGEERAARAAHSLGLVIRVDDAGQGLELVVRRRRGQGPFQRRCTLAPRVVGARAREHFPVRLDLRAFADRRELQRPQQDLAKMRPLRSPPTP